MTAPAPAGACPPGAHRGPHPALALALVAALLTGGCALLAAPTPDLAAPAGLPATAEIRQVPFYAQEEFQCGPATLAMALTFAGAPRTPQQLQSQVYLPERHGALQPEMLAAPRRAGLLTLPLEPELGAVLREVAAGHPVVVLQNVGWRLFPQWHYALVIGYALDPGRIVLRSGTTERLVMDLPEFARSWDRAGRWAFVVLPPRELPASATEDDVVAAIANLERVAPAAAGQAYAAALSRWPADATARIGMGNVAYAGHRLDEAEQAYRQAAFDHPDSGDAWNNLAQVLHETGRDPEALAAARRAVAIGGPRLDTYRETLRDVQAPH